MKKTEVMRFMKGGCLQSPSLVVKAISYALVLNPDRENLCPFRVDNSSVYPNIRTEDKPHASLCGTKFLSHSFKSFCGYWHATSEPAAELQQKTQSVGLWGKSFGRATTLVFGKRLCLQSRDSNFIPFANIQAKSPNPTFC